MPLVTLKEILPQARQEGRAVGAFNVANMESLSAVIQAAETEHLPVILQVFHRLFNDDKAKYLAAAAREMAHCSSVPVVLHLDHGQTIAQIVKAVRYGFSSVMIDASQLSFEENIILTQKAVKIAHDAGLSIEGEIGNVPANDENEIPLTDVNEALDFAEKTSVDVLAIAVGTAHGFYRQVPVINIKRARQIGNKLDIPMVLHGGSGTPNAKIRQLIKCGIAKINIATELHMIFLEETTRQVELYKKSFSAIDIFMNPVVESMISITRQKLRLFSGMDETA